MPEAVETVVVGGGHAGLATSCWLSAEGCEHVVLERGRVAERWRSERWDSFTLQAPNWDATLPGSAFDNGDPDGFARRDEIIEWLCSYACAIEAPVRTGCRVRRIHPSGNGRWLVEAESGVLEAVNVVVATGPYQVPVIPSFSRAIPGGIAQIAATDFKNAGEIPPGACLVVGSGSSG